MKTRSGLAWTVIAFGLFLGLPGVVQAAETPPNTTLSLTGEPGRYTFVEGDSSQFRALHWMDQGYAAGLKDFSLASETPHGVSIEAEGHAVVEDGDYSGLVSLKKEDVGYLHFDYTQFRKYYENSGGFYRPFATLNQNDTDKELALNIGKFGVEAGITMKNIPDITLLYEREFKQGTKSRLTWTTVTDSVLGTNVTKKIGPSWQQIDEIVDSFDVKVADTTSGFNWKGQQHWESVRANNMREEAQLSGVTSANASDSNQKIRDQFTEPRSDLITSTFNVDKWLWKEKAYVSGGYRYAQIQSRELENIFEYDQNRVLTNFANAEQVRDAHSDNLLTSQTWVGSFMVNLFKPLTVITRGKVEAIHRDGQSTYPKDNSPNNNDGTQKPNGTIDQIDVSENQEKVTRFGESVSLRYNGIPRVALYNEYEFEQTRSNLYEDRRSVSAGEVFNRQDIAHLYRGVGTLGGQFVPWNHFTLTMQGRYRVDDIDYDHVRYTNNSTTGAKSVFIDDQILVTDEATARASWKPCRWFQPSFRYQLMDRTYKTRGLPNSDVYQDAALLSSIYTWDLVSQPVDDLLMTASFSFQDGKIITPARDSASAAAIPTFDFDVATMLFSGEYSLNKDMVLVGTAQYTRAANFNDFSAIGLPLGADFHQTDLTAGVRWTPKKDMTVEPKYAFYQYRPDEDAEVGSFNAHVIWLEIKRQWG